MLALLQRVSQAAVVVDGDTIGETGKGLLVFLGVEKGDDEARARRLCERVLGYRIFADAEDRMNLSVADIHGQVLVVSQFTLAADTSRGMRPGFSTAAPPAEGERLYEYFLQCVRDRLGAVQCGRFGADMKVSLLNDGPVTFLLQV